MSRVVLTRHKDADQHPEHLVVGWDMPMATYFWAVMGKGEDEGRALRCQGFDHPNELPTWDMFVTSLPDEFEPHITWTLRRMLRQHENDPDCGRILVDLTDPPGWAAEMNTYGDPEDVFTGNGLSFKTKKEAEQFAKDLSSRWLNVRAFRVVPTDIQPNR